MLLEKINQILGLGRSQEDFLVCFIFIEQAFQGNLFSKSRQ